MAEAKVTAETRLAWLATNRGNGGDLREALMRLDGYEPAYPPSEAVQAAMDWWKHERPVDGLPAASEEACASP